MTSKVSLFLGHLYALLSDKTDTVESLPLISFEFEAHVVNGPIA